MLTKYLDGKVIRAERIDAGITQEALARAVGVHLRTLCRWEDGSTKPRIRLLRAIAKALARDNMDANSAKPTQSEIVSTAMLEAVAKCGITQVCMHDLAYLQLVFEECQKDYVPFTPQLARALLKAGER